MKLKPISNVGNQRALLYRRYTDLEKSITKSTIYSTYDGKYWSFSGETNQFIQVSSTYPHTEIQSVNSLTKLKFTSSYLSYLGGAWVNSPTPSYTYTTEEIEASQSSFEKTYDVDAKLFRGAIKMKVKNNSDGILYGGVVKIYSNDDATTPILTTSSTTYFSGDEKTFNIQSALLSNTTTGKIVLTSTTLTQAGTLTISFEYSFDTLTTQFPMVQKYQLNKYYYVGSFNYMLKGGVDTEDVQYIKGAITPTRTINIRWFEDEMQIDHDDLVVLEDRLWVVNSVSWDIKRMPKQFKVYFGTLTSIL